MSQPPPQVPTSPITPDGLPDTGNSPPRQNGQQTMPPPSPRQNGQQPLPLTNTTNTTNNTGTRGLPLPDNRHGVNQEDQEFFKEMRGWLMIVAILAAGSTYQAGLSPPGSFWQSDDSQGHLAGNPILHDKFFVRYKVFFYCNALSFLSSLVIIIFLMNKRFYRQRAKIKVLEITMVLDLFTFMVAYAAGSCRKASTSLIVFLLTGAVIVYVISFALSYTMLCNVVNKMPCARLWTTTPHV